MANPYVWQMVKEAVEELGGKCTNSQIKKMIKDKYGAVNENTINCQILICSVNKESRINWPENSKPRLANSQYDFLYNTGRGQVELYDPLKHGEWEIRVESDGKLRVGQVGATAFQSNLVADLVTEESEIENISDDRLLFPLELHLRDFIAKNLPSIKVDGENLRLFVDNDGVDGIEYQTDIGRIDILAVDDKDNFYIFELKLSRGSDQVLGQVLRYMGWVKEKLGTGKSVKGVIVAGEIDRKLRYAASIVQDVMLYKYQISFTLQQESLADLKIF